MKWCTSTIGGVCLPTEQRDPTRTPNETFRYIDIAAIDRTAKRITNAPEVLGTDAPSRARKAVRAGDVLVSTVRPNLNAVAIVPEHLDGQIASTGFCVLRADQRLADNKFIFYRCITPEFVGSLVGQMRGANYPAVSDSVVKQVELPLPTTREQRRIAEILEQGDELRQKRSHANDVAGRILPALFHNMFGDPATNPKGWARKKLGELLQCIDSGWSPVCENRQAVGDEWGILKLGAVTSNRYLEAENKALPLTLTPEPELEVRAGDLLFTRKNTYELVGACAYVKSTRAKLMLSDTIFRLNLKSNAEIHPLYLWALLIYPTKRQAIQLLAGGSAGSMPNISKGRLETLVIEKPPYRLQDVFADAVSNCESLRDKASEAQENIEALFATMLHRAFTGELTAKWREAHLKELIGEMEQQARLLRSSPNGKN
jgi:type I restriction enzyme S subunit